MKILVLAGGFDQIALIQELQLRGHEVILADYLENPPAKKYVKKYFQISTLDENAIYHLAIQEKADLITTACTDQALLTVARVAERLGMPFYVSSLIAKNITNKAYMKKKFKEFDIPSADWILLEKEENIEEINNSLNFPLIVKPCDANSSKGVTKVQNQKSLAKAIDNAFLISRSKKVIVETYVEGIEISIDAWIDSKSVKILLISEIVKIKDNEDAFTIFQSRYPVELSDKAKHRIQDIAERIGKAFELEDAPLLIQAIIRDDDIVVVECSARMGGGSKYKFVEHITGFNIMRFYVDRILGDIMPLPTIMLSTKCIELDYVYGYNGIFQKLLGFQEKLCSGDIVELFLYKMPGSEIEKKISSSDRILGFLLEADTYEELKKKRYEVLKTADILDKDGRSIMYKECFYRDGF